MHNADILDTRFCNNAICNSQKQSYGLTSSEWRKLIFIRTAPVIIIALIECFNQISEDTQQKTEDRISSFLNVLSNCLYSFVIFLLLIPLSKYKFFAFLNFIGKNTIKSYFVFIEIPIQILDWKIGKEKKNILGYPNIIQDEINNHLRQNNLLLVFAAYMILNFTAVIFLIINLVISYRNFHWIPHGQN